MEFMVNGIEYKIVKDSMIANGIHLYKRNTNIIDKNSVLSWVYIGHITFENLVSIVNRPVIKCKYGHGLTVEKRRKKGE